MQKLLGKQVSVYETIRTSGQDIQTISSGIVTAVEGHMIEVMIEAMRIETERLEQEKLPAIAIFNTTASSFRRILLFPPKE